MRRKGVRRLAGLVLAAAVAAPCGCARSRQTKEAEAAVRAYNEALILAYRTNDPRGLERVAGPDELRKLIALIDLKREGSLALESQVTEFEALGVGPAGAGRLLVKTRERWRYRDKALKPGISPGPEFLVDMWMSWEVGRESGTWKVLKGRTERTEYLEPKGYRPGATPAAAASGERGTS